MHQAETSEFSRWHISRLGSIQTVKIRTKLYRSERSCLHQILSNIQCLETYPGRLQGTCSLHYQYRNCVRLDFDVVFLRKYLQDVNILGIILDRQGHSQQLQPNG